MLPDATAVRRQRSPPSQTTHPNHPELQVATLSELGSPRTPLVGSVLRPRFMVRWVTVSIGSATRRRRGAMVVGISGLGVAGLVAALFAPWADASSSPGTALSIFAGSGALSQLVPGPGISSPMDYPKTLSSDSAGNLYVAFGLGSSDQYSIAKITRGGVVSY